MATQEGILSPTGHRPNPHGEYNLEEVKTLAGISNFLSEQTRQLDNVLDVQNHSVGTFIDELSLYQTSVGQDQKMTGLSKQMRSMKNSTVEMQKQQSQTIEYLK